MDLSNQRLPHSAIEDAINKPWRPIPAGRITSDQSRRLLLAVIPSTLAIGWSFGVVAETAALIILSCMYNDLRGADEHFILRNLFNTAGYTSFGIGALHIMCGSDVALNSTAYIWIAIIGAIIFSTISVQDLRDQEGDKASGRDSAPLVLGDLFTRWMVALLVLFWSVACPLFFHVDWWAYIGPVGVGVWVAGTLASQRNPVGDKLSLKPWGFWLIVLYLLPFIKNSIYLR